MARNRYIKTHSNYVIKDLHQSTNAGNIFERDFMTISNLNSYAPGSVPAYELNGFKMVVRNGINKKKKHHYGNWVKNKSCDRNSFYWTLNCVDETEKRQTPRPIKPNRRNILSFSCYGSASKLIESTIVEIINKFPAEVFFTDKKIVIEGKTYYLVSNPFNIEFDKHLYNDATIFNPLRVFSESIQDYMFVTENGLSSSTLSWDFKTFSQQNICETNGVILSRINLGSPFNDGGTILLYYCMVNGEKILLHDGLYTNARLTPKQKHITAFFDNLSEFGATLLDRKTGYTAVLETPYETSRGNRFVRKSYTWPKTEYGNWNIDISDIPYLTYIDSLMKIAEFYDEYASDNIWRSMTHEAIINFDWTHVSVDEGGTAVENRDPNSSAIKAFIHVAGRQFDELKMYIDGIKVSNAVTYDENSNKPDELLVNDLENCGWEVIAPLNSGIKNYPTSKLYPTHVEGYFVEDANIEFYRRLLLNTNAILNAKGTKRAIEMVMSLFGYYSTHYIENSFHEVNRNGNIVNLFWDELEPEEQAKIKCYSYDMTEYVYVANEKSGIWGSTREESNDIANEVKRINQLKELFDEDKNDDLQGLPLKEVHIMSNESKLSYREDEDGNVYSYYTPSYTSYLIPWFDKNIAKDKMYDADIYFESKGGWGLKQTTIAQLNDTDEKIIDSDATFKVYDETVKYLRFVENLDSLINVYGEFPSVNTVYYVYDIDETDVKYDWGKVSIKNGDEVVSEPSRTLSHYFILKDIAYDHILGVRRDADKMPKLVDEEAAYDEEGNVINFSTTDENGFPKRAYGWKNISEEEISEGITDDAKKIYYIESIIETNTGNNPHCGFGKYDDGETYLSNFKDVFKGAKDNKKFYTLSDDKLPNGYGFEFDKMVDNVKCWFFTDTFNTDTKLKKLNYDENDNAEINENNELSTVGYGNFLRLDNNRDVEETDNIFSSSPYENMTPYNMEDESNESDEAAANSIVNSKQLFIEFAKDMQSPESTFNFIENSVMFYVKQVVPSTTLLKYYVHMRDNEVNCYNKTYLQSAIIN